MVAVGSLYALWLDVPAVSGMEELRSGFASHFGKPWGETMLGGELPLAYHRDWNAFVAVSELREGPGWPFWELTGFHLQPGDGIYRIMAG
ncbi:MAG: hypothetical protein K6T29_03820 [Peptococcaceae bacterium]|nr:hypothetical protein [Peptococcaceae bacterium]